MSCRNSKLVLYEHKSDWLLLCHSAMYNKLILMNKSVKDFSLTFNWQSGICWNDSVRKFLVFLRSCSSKIVPIFHVFLYATSVNPRLNVTRGTYETFCKRRTEPRGLKHPSVSQPRVSDFEKRRFSYKNEGRIGSRPSPARIWMRYVSDASQLRRCVRFVYDFSS
jgi:hypothetical protein